MFLWILAFAWILYGIPRLIQVLRPDTITKIDRMISRTRFQDCSVAVMRDDEASIRLTVSSDPNSTITTELSKYELKELHPAGNGLLYLFHTVNQHPDRVYYLTFTKIIASGDLQKASRISVEYCDRMADPAGRVDIQDDIPRYECAVPIAKATCQAATQNGE